MNWRFEIYETLASTSDFCRERAEAGENEGLAVLARRQSAARGSRGRNWESGEGNLAFSFLLHFSEKSSFRSVLPYLVAVAVYDGVYAASVGSKMYEPNAAYVPKNEIDLPLSLKWPNDLLLMGRKMAGILIETGGSGVSASSEKGSSVDEQAWAVIGVGANLCKAPHVEGRSLAALADIISPPTVEKCAKEILCALDKWRQCWQQGGDQAIWQGWMERAHPIGTRLIVRRHDRDIKGQFAGLDMQGHLLLTLDDGTVTSIVTGDIICE